MGRPCVVGCTELTVNAAHRTARLANATIHEGDWLSMDAGTGSIHLGRAGVVSERPEAELAEIERWRMAVPA